MFGNNPIRKPVHGDGSWLEVKSTFPTLQGEGPFTGQPAVFVRLGGCNLACSFCDTDFEEFHSMELSDLLERIQELSQAQGKRVRHLVVITGGEPLRQNIAPLCQALLNDGFSVQIETNGTLWRELPAAVHVVCSPKHTKTGYHPIRPDLLKRISAFKFLVSQRHEGYSDIPDIGQGQYGQAVYVQPMDEYDERKNAENTAHALALCQQHGYHLSLQTHKILGIE